MATAINDKSMRELLSGDRDMAIKALQAAGPNAAYQPTWKRMVRVLVYEGPEDWVDAQRHGRSLKESMYLKGSRITETEITVQEMTDGERKQAKVAINLTNRDSRNGDTQPAEREQLERLEKWRLQNAALQNLTPSPTGQAVGVNQHLTSSAGMGSAGSYGLPHGTPSK